MNVQEKILTMLEQDARLTPAQIADMVELPVAEVQEIIRELERSNTILGYRTLIDWDKTSMEKVTALIEVRVTPQRGEGFDKIAERIYNYPEVHAVYLISGAYDLMVILEGKTLKGVSMFVTDKLSTIDQVVGTATHFILKKYKDHGTVLGQAKTDERMVITP